MLTELEVKNMRADAVTERDVLKEQCDDCKAIGLHAYLSYRSRIDRCNLLIGMADLALPFHQNNPPETSS